MKNEFEVVVTIRLKTGGVKTVNSGDPMFTPRIRDIAAFTDDFLETIMKMYPESEIISINYLPQMLHRG